MAEGSTNGAGPAPADDAARDAAIAVINGERAEIADKPGELTLSNGIVLRLKAPPQHLIREVSSRVPAPEIPVVMIEEKGRKEENPSDPDYQAALVKWNNDQALAAADVALLMGTECLSVPPDMFRPEEDGWLSFLKIVGVEPDLGTPSEAHPLTPERYWAWLRFYALRNDEDSFLAVRSPLWLANLSEEDVAKTIASFRRLSRGGSDPVGTAIREGQNGDRDPASVPGPDQRVRGARGRKVRAGAVGAVAPAPKA